MFLVLAVLAFAGGAVAVLTLTETGRENLAGMISDLASTPDAKVKVTGLSGIWSGALRLDQLVLEDAQGPWLAARDVAIDWSPLKLFGMTFSADLVTAGRVEVARRPQPSSDRPAEGGSFTLPVDVAVKAIDLPDVALGESVTGGRVASVAAKGKLIAEASPLRIDSDLTVTRNDGVAGEIVAAIDFAPDQNRLEVDVKASEPSGGILANLLGLPGKPAVDIIVTGSGPAANWRGTGTFSVDGALIASVSGTHRFADGNSEIAATGDGAFASFLPERFRHLAEGQTRFDVAGTLTPAGGVFVKRAELEGTALSATAAGQIDPQGATDFSLEVSVPSGGVPLAFGTEEAPIDLVLSSATVRALGDGREPALDISAQLPSVSTNDVRLSSLAIAIHSDGFDLRQRLGSFSGNATAGALVIDNPTVEPLVAGQIRAELEGVLEVDALTVSKGVLRSDAIDGSFDGRVSLADGSITLGLKAGVLSTALPQAVRPLLGDNVALSTSLERDTDGNVSANKLALVSGGLKLDGSARLFSGQIEAKLDGTLSDIAPALPGASGALQLSATATGPFVAPGISATLTSDRVDYKGKTLEAMQLSAASTFDRTTPDLQVGLKGQLQGQPLDAKAVLSTAQAEKAVRDIALSLGSNRIAGAVTLDDAFLPAGTLTFDLPDVASLAALAGQSVQGSAAGTATFTRDGGRPQVKLVATSGSIAQGTFAATAISIDALVSDFLSAPSISGTVGATLADLVPGQPPAALKVAVEGNVAEVTASGTMAIQDANISTFSARYRRTDAGGALEAKGDALLAGFLPERLKPLGRDPLTFDLTATIGANGVVAIDRVLAFNNALQARGGGSYDPDGDMDVTLDIGAVSEAIPLAFGTPDAPIDIALRGAKLHAVGPSARPAVDIEARMASVAAPGARLSEMVVSAQSPAFEVSTRSGAVKASVTAEAAVLDNAAAAPLVAGKLTADLDAMLAGDGLTIARAGVMSEALRAAMSGTVAFDGAMGLALNADIAAAALPAAARPALGERVAVAAKLTRTAEGALSVEDLTATSGPLSAAGTAKLAGDTVDAKIDATLADVASLAKGATGDLRLSASVAGLLAAPDIAANVTSERIGFGEHALEALNLSASGKLGAEAPDIAVALTGAVDGQPLDAKATLDALGLNKSVRDLILSLGPNRIAGSLDLDEAFRPAGTVTFDLPDLGALAALAGQSVQGAATGTATFTNDGAVPQVKLSATSESIARGTLSATAVTVDTTVSDYMAAPSLSGTVGATLADLLSGQPPADIRVALDGTPADVRASGTLAMEGATVSSFTAGYRQSDAGGVVEAKGDATLARFLPEQARIAMPDPTAFDIAAIIGAGGVIQIERATAANAALSANASGRVDPAGSMDLTVDLGAGSGAAPLALGTPEAPIDIVLQSGTLRATGAFDRPMLDVDARLASVATKDARVSDLALSLHSDAFDPASRSGPVTGSVTAAAVSLDNAAVAPLIAGKVGLEFAGALTRESLTIDDGRLSSDALAGRVSGSISLADGSLTLDVSSDIASAALPAAARPVLGDRVALSATVARGAAGDLAVDGLKITSGPLAATGSARFAGDTIDAAVEGTLGDIAPLAAQASGAIGFRASAKGPLSAPDLDVTVSSDRMTVASRAIENLVLNATGKADMQNPSANISLKGTVAGETLDGRAVLQTADGRRSLRDLNLSLGPNRIAGALSLDEAFVPEGSIDLDIPDIGPLAALALEAVEGSIKGSIVFDRVGGSPRARVSAKSGSITRGDLLVRTADVQATISDYLESPGVAGRIHADEVRSGTTIVRGIDVDLAREGSWTRFTGGATVSGIPLKAAGRVEVANGTTTVDLASASATVQGIQTKLARATTVKIVDGRTSLDGLALALGSGTARISGSAGTTLDLDVTLSGLPASLANSFAAGLDASGPISGTVKVSGAAANPSVRYSIEWSGAQTSQTRSAGIGGLSVRSSGTFAGNRLTFDASAGDGSGLDFRGGGTVAVGAPVGLDLNFKGSVPFGLLSRQLAAQGMSLSGTATVDVAVRGTAASPAISGSVRTSGARLVDANSGLAVNDIAAEVTLDSNRATISRLTGALSSGGSITGSGSVGIASGSGFPADLAIRVEKARYTDGQVVTTTVSADLAVKGPLLSAPALTGTIDLGRTVITIPERLPSSLAALDVKHKGAPAAVVRQEEALRPKVPASGSSGGLRLDVTVNAPQQIFIQGRGLDAELGGSVRLIGPVSAPQAVGEFDLRRGRLSLLGRRLTFTQGTITFAGSLVPDLNFAAESVATDATVTVLVTGPANNPKFSFTSVPALPEDEVLARLIFGRAMGSLSPLQIAQLADAAAQLAGRGGTSSLLNGLRDRLGVDDLDVRTTDEGSTAVSVGKYLNDRTYLTIEAGDKAGSGKAAIDLDVGKGVKLRGEAHDDGEAKAGIFFEREY